MPTENYSIVAGLVAGIIVLLIVASFIFILVNYYNKKKKKFIEERHYLQMHFQEQLLQSQLEMQEQTFNSISTEIHDNVGQQLSLAKVQLNIMEQDGKSDPLMVSDLKETIGKAMIDLRDIAKSLNSDRIKFNSLSELTNHELQRITRLGTVKPVLFSEGTETGIDEKRKLIILRIIQEALQNILKHARAKNISVFFYFNADHFKLEIKDDGIGFDWKQSSPKEGLGLQNIINRASLMGGVAEINSVLNKGTVITIIVPYAR